MKHSIILGTGTAIWWVTEPHWPEDPQHNDSQHSNTHHNNKNVTIIILAPVIQSHVAVSLLSIVILSVLVLNVVMLSQFCLYAVVFEEMEILLKEKYEIVNFMFFLILKMIF
jgi:hypothetical protein